MVVEAMLISMAFLGTVLLARVGLFTLAGRVKNPGV